ncbi:MAG: aminotransferase class III-fold pyridoxal phosphate-dependent enzyme [Methylococcaceae bacterium]|nr:MAG: aminotransferase class III-fold pyridoxal phosphate-dependent enzyme [Methylococcaceae bacterium]
MKVAATLLPLSLRERPKRVPYADMVFGAALAAFSTDGMAFPPPVGNAGYLERQAASESNARSYPRRLPVALQRGQGIYVEDADGRRYIDCLAGAGALALGHYHTATPR